MAVEKAMNHHEDVIRGLRIWSGPVTIEPLNGGLSNANYKVSDAARTVMVRVGADLPFHHVFREREAAVSRAAEAAGLSPPLIHAEPGVMVFAFLTAQTFGAADVRARAMDILPLLKTCHEKLAEHLTGPAPLFWVFHVIRDYVATLRASGAAGGEDLNRLLEITRRLEAAQVPMPMVFGHNDLLPANLMDDGNRLWLVDWEYGGFGSPLFDLANLAGNAGFDEESELALLAGYFGRDADAALKRAFEAMKVASLLREMLWSLVSGLTMNAPGADYAAYAAENRARFEAALAAFEDVTS